MDRIRFCTHCAARERDADSVEALLRRVCPRCGLGVLLSASPDLVSACGDVLLVVTADLRIAAATTGVEPLLGAAEPLVGRALPELLAPSDLSQRASDCARGAAGVSSHLVEVAGRAMTARVGACGNPPAALVALLPEAAP